MGRSYFLTILLISSLLFLSFSTGFGRALMGISDDELYSTARAEESAGKSRVTFEVMDYADPEPNTNPKSGYLSPPSPFFGSPCSA